MDKEMWFREMESLLGEYEDEGLPFDQAYAKAGENAQQAVVDRLADAADLERKRRREEGK